MDEDEEVAVGGAATEDAEEEEGRGAGAGTCDAPLLPLADTRDLLAACSRETARASSLIKNNAHSSPSACTARRRYGTVAGCAAQ